MSLFWQLYSGGRGVPGRCWREGESGMMLASAQASIRATPYVARDGTFAASLAPT